MNKIGIIGAMDEEVSFLKTIAKPLNGGKECGNTQAGSLSFFEGEIEGQSVVIVQSGIGKVNAALCAQRLILQFGVTHIINTGIAGAAAKGLGVLDMVVSTDAVQHDMNVTAFGYKPTVIPRMESSAWKADEKMVKAALEAFESNKDSEPFAGHKLISGRIASGDQFIEDRATKNHIIDICSPACVEMEGAAIAQACYLNNTPYLILRCMSDMADDGEAKTYDFNDKIAANMSAKLVIELLKRL